MINGRIFSETYCFKNESKGFLLLICHESKGNPSEFIQDSQKKKLNLFDIDTLYYWCIPVKWRWVKSLSKYTDNRIPGLYAQLLQYLKEEGIKTFYYDIWLVNKNYHQRKKNISEQHEFNFKRKRGLLPEKVDPAIVHITQSMSLREASKMSL